MASRGAVAVSGGRVVLCRHVWSTDKGGNGGPIGAVAPFRHC